MKPRYPKTRQCEEVVCLAGLSLLQISFLCFRLLVIICLYLSFLVVLLKLYGHLYLFHCVIHVYIPYFFCPIYVIWFCLIPFTELRVLHFRKPRPSPRRLRASRLKAWWWNEMNSWPLPASEIWNLYSILTNWADLCEFLRVLWETKSNVSLAEVLMQIHRSCPEAVGFDKHQGRTGWCLWDLFGLSSCAHLRSEIPKNHRLLGSWLPWVASCQAIAVQKRLGGNDDFNPTRRSQAENNRQLYILRLSRKPEGTSGS